ncbi:hypothetical protein TNCT6_02460 [Streptomyces sp. 6-11-2]|nr:hypothetical protein TNCT6_02460 [Streptomyces sp. 6-11-2]
MLGALPGHMRFEDGDPDDLDGRVAGCGARTEKPAGSAPAMQGPAVGCFGGVLIATGPSGPPVLFVGLSDGGGGAVDQLGER